jgi:putative FmdB family regulatory protein
MPIYEFVCNKCNTKFDEYFRSSSERKKLFCPSCQDDDIRKVFSVFGLSVGGNNSANAGGASSSCGTCTASSCAGCG